MTTRVYYPALIQDILILLIPILGFIFRKSLATNGAKSIARILGCIIAIIGIIGWTGLLFGMVSFANAMAGAGDGAGTGRHGTSPLDVLVLCVIWLVPTTGFVFMFLTAINKLQGRWRIIGYWWSIVIVVIAGLALMWCMYRYHWFGLALLMFAVLWGFAMHRPQKS